MSCTLCGSSQHTAPHCKWRNTCTSCTHAEKPTSREMLKAGFVRCNEDRRAYAHKSPTIGRECKKHAVLDVGAVAKRVAWIEGRI